MVLFGTWMLKRPSRFLHDEKSDPQLAANRIVRPGRTAGVRVRGSLVLCSATTTTINLAQRCTSSWILCCASVENALNTTNQQQFGETYFVSTPECCELDNLDGKHFVVEWQIFPGHTTTQLLQEAPNMMEDTLQIHSPEFRGPHHIVDVQRHRLDHKKKHNSLFGEFVMSFCICRHVSHWSLEFPRSKRRE